nr:clink protein [Pea necrotic yellow dwarf virus]
MGLKYFSFLPVELKEKIVREHMQEERKKEFLEKSITASCRKLAGLTEKTNITSDEISILFNFLGHLVDYFTRLSGTRCLIRWKDEVPVKIKFGVMDQQHYELYGPSDMDDLSCRELFIPEVEDDITYEVGMIVNVSELEVIFKDLGIHVCYITIGKGYIETPLFRRCNQ